MNTVNTVEKKYYYSEIFYSIQGEGHYTGVPTAWLRFFLCNLQCNGFGQVDPTNPDTYELPFEQIDISHITDVRELPVFDKGCDSSYTWSRKYRHLISTRTVEDGVNELTELLPGGKFIHPKTGQEVHMVFTGGEPLLQPTQPGIIAVLKEFNNRNNFPNFVTVETNGTREISDELFDYIKENYSDVEGREWYWSLSPKLWSTAGEKPKKAIKPEFVGKYAQTGANGQLKFVVNGSKESWEEVETYTQMYRDCGVDYPVWIMGVGGTLEGLKITEADIADEAIDRGYRYSSRVHVHIYGNAIGK